MKLYLCLLALFCGLFIQTALSQEQVIPADAIPPAEVTAYSANRTNRLFHNLFHNIRMNWPLLDEIEQREIENLGWKPLFPSFAYINNDINQPIMLMGPTGEDFLWMHRQMINEVNQKAASIVPAVTWRVDGWYDCPAHTDTTWPVPSVPDDITAVGYREYLNYYKTQDFYDNEIRPREIQMNSTAYLRSLTLGEFGTLLEYELHTFFHVRFSAYNPIGYRIQSLHPTLHIDTKWDDPEYDYLADFYSAHVNPTFWKIHGWIERKIEHWAIANGYTATTVPWTSTWEMGPMDVAILRELEAVGARAYERAHSGDSWAKEIVGAVLGALVCCVLILLAGYFCMIKMTKNSSGNAKPAHHTTESQPLKV